MPFVRAAPRSRCLSANNLQISEVINNGHLPSAKHFEMLFAQLFAAVGKIRNCRQRTIGKTQIHHHAVLHIQPSVQGAGGHTNNGRAREKSRYIHEVANLAEDAPAANLRIVNPVAGGRRARVDANGGGWR